MSDTRIRKLERELELPDATRDTWRELLVAYSRQGDAEARVQLAVLDCQDRPSDQAAWTKLRELCSDPKHGLAYDDPTWGRMCYVPSGMAIVGSRDDGVAFDNEKPRHLVYVQAFYLAQLPVSLEQWKSAGDTIDRAFADRYRNVVNVSWSDVTTLLGRTRLAGASSRVFRGGFWSFVASYCRAACCYRRSPGYRDDYLGFRPAMTILPTSPEVGRTFRGGSLINRARLCRASFRIRYTPDIRDNILGFRVAVSPQDSNYRLPTEDEFEYVARCWDGRVYPWGDAFIDSQDERALVPGPFGHLRLCGNVWQWCADDYVADRRPLIEAFNNLDRQPRQLLPHDAAGTP